MPIPTRFGVIALVDGMKKTVNFRFGEETLETLASLAERWGCTRTQVLERLLAEAEGKKS